jgi:Ran GTPase-activating protein (RanGAP) involved in mRNA processing and transport
MELIDQDMEIIAEQAIYNKQCKLLSLQSNKITSIGAGILADALNNNTTLETLYLTNNYISDDGIDSLVNILSVHNNTLKTLVFQKNRITDKGAKHLAELLKTNQTIIWLYLGENDITDEGIRVLAKTIETQNNTLEMLVLSSNKLLTDASIDDLLQMIEHNQSLKKLWIDDCNLSDASKQRLNKIQQSKKDFYVRV